jgi:hypothetical protein
MDAQRIRELLDQRDELDRQIAAAAMPDGTSGALQKPRAPQKCGVCGNEGHTARTCPQKPQ